MYVRAFFNYYESYAMDLIKLFNEVSTFQIDLHKLGVSPYGNNSLQWKKRREQPWLISIHGSEKLSKFTWRSKYGTLTWNM